MDRLTAISHTPSQVSYVPHDCVDYVWDDVAPILELALARSDEGTSIGDVKAGIETATLFLWIVGDLSACVVGRIDQRKNALSCWLLAGSGLEEWYDDLMAAAARYARDLGLSRIEACVRPGFQRVLSRKGWRTVHHRMAMDLTHG